MINNKTYQFLFGNIAVHSTSIKENLHSEIIKKDEKFSFLDNSYFLILFEQIYKEKGIEIGISAVMQIYWNEMMQRIYVASISGFLRQHSWIDGVCLAYQEQNYIQFCASVRGFLESSSDLYDALYVIPMTLAYNYKAINEGILGKSKTLFVNSKLEQTLLHFQYASNKNRIDGLAPKTMKEYMNNPHLLSLNLYSLYGKLCEITHPAQLSLDEFIDNNNEEYSCFKLNPQNSLNGFVKEHGDVIKNLFMMTENLLIILMKTINLFNGPFHISAVDSINCNEIKIWKQIESIVKEQSKI